MKCADAPTEDKCDSDVCQWVSGKCRPLATMSETPPTFFEWMIEMKQLSFGQILLRVGAWIVIIAALYFVLRLAWYQGIRRMIHKL